MPRKKSETKKPPVVINKDNLLVQPLTLTLLGINPSVTGNRVTIAIVKRLQEAFRDMIGQHHRGKEWVQLSIFDTEGVRDYLGDNQLVFTVRLNELVDDPKHYQDAFNAACQLADVVIWVPIQQADGTTDLVRDNLFRLILKVDSIQSKDKNGNNIYRYPKNARPEIGFAINKKVAEYIFGFQKRYGEFLDYPALTTNLKYYPPIYSYLSGCYATRGAEWEEDYFEFRRILGFEDKKADGHPVYDKLPLFADFQKRVLRAVMEAINQDADNNLIDLRFSYERIDLNGRKTNPDRLRFRVEPSALGKAIRSDKAQVREVIELEKRLKNEFRQTDKQVRAIMKRLPLDRRDQFTARLNDLSARVKAGKVSIDTDANSYWNRTFTNYLDTMQAEPAPSAPAMTQPPTDAASYGEGEKSPVSSPDWDRFLEYARGRVGESDYTQWFSQLTLEDVSDGHPVVGVPSRTFFEMFSHKYADILSAACQEFQWKVVYH